MVWLFGGGDHVGGGYVRHWLVTCMVLGIEWTLGMPTMKARFFELTESRQQGYTPTLMAFD